MDGFDQILPDEFVVLAKVCNKENEGDLEATLDDITCIDRLLTMSKSRSLMVRKRSPKFHQMIDMVIHKRLNNGTELVFNSATQKMVYIPKGYGSKEIDFSHRKKKKK